MRPMHDTSAPWLGGSMAGTPLYTTSTRWLYSRQTAATNSQLATTGALTLLNTAPAIPRMGPAGRKLWEWKTNGASRRAREAAGSKRGPLTYTAPAPADIAALRCASGRVSLRNRTMSPGVLRPEE